MSLEKIERKEEEADKMKMKKASKKAEADNDCRQAE